METASQVRTSLPSDTKLMPVQIIEGVSYLMTKDSTKPLDERYVHSIKSTENGGLLIFTFVPSLLSLIHKTPTIQVDTTFKRTAGDMKEWEIVIWYSELMRGTFYFQI